MKLYTRRGDRGQTDLFGGERISKDHLRVEAYGTLDELNALLGCVLAEMEADLVDLAEDLRAVQNTLFVLGADLATPVDHPRVSRLDAAATAWLEQRLDAYQQELTPLRAFVLPGGTRAAALLHLARTVCRRAERRAVALLRAEESLNPETIRYLNRLSDLLFVLARLVNRRYGAPEPTWNPEDCPR